MQREWPVQERLDWIEFSERANERTNERTNCKMTVATKATTTTTTTTTPRATRRRHQKSRSGSLSSADADDNDEDKLPPAWKIWWTAARPHTLTASVSPNIVAWSVGTTFLPHFIDDYDTNNSSTLPYTWLVLEWTFFCILMQLGCNLHNDYADFVKGADDDKRVGQARATAKGWLSPSTTARAAAITLFGGFVVGMKFLTSMVSSDAPQWTIVSMLFIILSSIFNAFAYTGGPWPLGYLGLSSDFSLGYSGLGDLFVFLYFGLVATIVPSFIYLACSTTTVASQSNTGQDDSYSSMTLWQSMTNIMPYAIQVSVLAVNIIVVNNLRDRHTDVSANKRTLAVRFGATFCRLEYGFMIGIAYGLVICEFLFDFNNPTTVSSYWTLLPMLSFPRACREWIAIYNKEGGDLNPHVGGAAKVQFLFCILLALSLRIPQ